MARLVVADVCGQAKVTREDGARLREAIVAAWRDGPVEVDFGGVPIASVSFLDEAIVRLTLDHSVAEVVRRIRPVQLTDPDRRLLNKLLQARKRATSMDHLVDGVRKAVAAECWYAALALALALPDTCGAIDEPTSGSKKRYTAWVERYVADHFRADEPAGTALISSADLYRFRCSFLHEGDFEVDSDQVASSMFDVLNRITLFVSEFEVTPSRGLGGGTSFMMAVKDLCEWICVGVENWQQEAQADSVRSKRIAELGRIRRLPQWELI